MHVPTIIVLSLVLGFLTCSNSDPQTSSPSENPADVVRQYVSLAYAGEYDKLGSVTLAGPEKPKTAQNTGAEIKNAGVNLKSSRGLTVVPDTRPYEEARYEWITGDFPKSIHDGKLSIKSVKNESANDTEARVEIIFGNETTTNLLGWVFLLHKVNDNWKIYHVTTAGEPLEPLTRKA